MEKYKEYKPTSIQWLKEIPSHWNTIRIKWLLTERIEKSEDGIGTPLSMSQKLGLVPTSEMDIVPNQTSSYVGAKKTYENDLVFNKLKAHLGVFAISKYNGLVSPDYAVYTPTERAYLPYLEYLFHTQLYISEFTKKSSGVAIGLTRLYTPGLFSIHSIYPPLPEQEKIVNYLDSKTSKIDTYVAERERELRLLNELKESEIANVITRGLDPDVKMKVSTIPWLVVIPEHWNEGRAKYLFQRENRPVSEDDEVITCFRDGQVTLRKNRRTTGFTESFKEFGYQGIRKGDLVIHQMDAFAGSVGISDSDGKATPVYIVCTPKRDDVFNPYFALVIRNMGLNGYIQSLYRGIRERSSDFKYEVFARQTLPLPPLSEQRAIVSYIEAKCVKINSLISELEAEIEYLKEYKQRLIADCVTGQINVQKCIIKEQET